ncbi:hypothetical protein GCM10020219_013390 [Nonomuraea dietziae]
MSEQWHEVGDRVFVRRHESYDLNVGLVVGDGHCLVLDTRETARRASDLVAAIRRITPDPWTVVNSHAHFDHYFGNAMFVPAEIWAHARAAEEIEKDGEAVRDRVAAGREPEAADVEIVAPDHTFTDRATLDIGGRPRAPALLRQGAHRQRHRRARPRRWSDLRGRPGGGGRAARLRRRLPP